MAIGTPTLCTATTNPIGDTTAASSYAIANLTYPANSDLFLGISNAKGSTPDAVSSVSDSTLTWAIIDGTEGTELFATIASPNCRLSVFHARNSGAELTGKTLTVSFGGNNQTGCNLGLLYITGVNSISSTVQVVSGSDDDVDTGETMGVTLSAAQYADHRALLFVAGNVTSVSWSAGSNMTELFEISHAAPAVALAAYWRSDAFETTPDAVPGVNNTQSAAIGMELRGSRIVSKALQLEHARCG